MVMVDQLKEERQLLTDCHSHSLNQKSHKSRILRINLRAASCGSYLLGGQNMGILQSSALTLVVGAIGAFITLYLTYLFNRFTKKTEEYRKQREDQEAAALKKKNKTMLLCS